MRLTSIAFLFGALVFAGLAHADVLNGDFEAGSTGWSVSVPTGWSVRFPPAGGHPGGYVRFESPSGGAGSMACIRQVFECGIPNPGSTCNITFDYMSDLGQDGVSASVRIIVNGIEYGSALGSFGWQGNWIGGSCGTKDLQICLRVEPGAPRWALLIDNVASVSFCDAVAIERSLWGTFKSLYRD